MFNSKLITCVVALSSSLPALSCSACPISSFCVFASFDRPPLARCGPETPGRAWDRWGGLRGRLSTTNSRSGQLLREPIKVIQVLTVRGLVENLARSPPNGARAHHDERGCAHPPSPWWWPTHSSYPCLVLAGAVSVSRSKSHSFALARTQSLMNLTHASPIHIRSVSLARLCSLSSLVCLSL